jgi:hypothetical protein
MRENFQLQSLCAVVMELYVRNTKLKAVDEEACGAVK